MQELQADLFVVCAYGKILSQKVIDTPKHIINIHASLLPKYRGAAPIHAAIKNGDSETGISIMKIVKELDAGAVMLIRTTPISAQDNLESVTSRLSEIGAHAICDAVKKIEADDVQWAEQNHTAATYAHKIQPDDAKINWNGAAVDVHNFIRSYAPAPGAFTMFHDDKIKIMQSKINSDQIPAPAGTVVRGKKNLSIACSDHWLDILTLQPVGKKVMDIASFLNGYRKDIKRCA